MTALPQRLLGHSGIYTSAIGLGTVKFGRNLGVKYPRPFDLPGDAQILDLLALARDMGINTLDTAPAYGLSEARLGQLLTNRQDWIIVNKAGEQFINGHSAFDFSAAALRRSLEQSLSTLKTDYLDVFLLHSDGRDLEIINEGGLDTLQRFKDEGKIRSFGMSTKTTEGAIACLEQADTVMLSFHPEHTEERPALDFAIQQKKGCFIKKVLDSGHIKSPEAQAAHIRYAYAHPAACSLIIGTLNPEHLRQNVQVLMNQPAKE